MQIDNEPQMGAIVQAINESGMYSSVDRGVREWRIYLNGEDVPAQCLEDAAWQLSCWRWSRARWLSEHMIY